jgi:hypothetical protein
MTPKPTEFRTKITITPLRVVNRQLYFASLQPNDGTSTDDPDA